MNFYTLFLLFIFYSFLGWLIEILGKLFEKKKFINRGFLIGPYCPIYGFGAILIFLLWHNYIDDLFVSSILIFLTSAILEYCTSLVLEKIFKTRWWDYSKRRFNINGRICLELLIPFTIAGLIVIYLINPHILSIIEQTSPNIIKVLSLILLLAFITDFILTVRIMTNFKNITKSIKCDSTEKINKLVRKTIEKNNIKFQKRLFKAFPHLKILNEQIKNARSKKS